jgi:hypothetical protein
MVRLVRKDRPSVPVGAPEDFPFEIALVSKQKDDGKLYRQDFTVKSLAQWRYLKERVSRYGFLVPPTMLTDECELFPRDFILDVTKLRDYDELESVEIDE